MFFQNGPNGIVLELLIERSKYIKSRMFANFQNFEEGRLSV